MNSVAKIAEAILVKKAAHEGQLIVAIAGPPAAGKSTLTDALEGHLGNAAILSMDGYHLDNSILADRNLSDRKGAPETFDVAGLAHLLDRLRSGQDVLAPSFDRDLDLSRGAAVSISTNQEIVLVEGNYLLLDEKPWSDLHRFWDLTIMLHVPPEILKERLIHRWRRYGLGVDVANAKANQNDLPNGKRVLEKSVPSDLVIEL